MSKLFKTLVLMTLITSSGLIHAELTCQSVGVASCKTANGFCVEYVESEDSDPDMWENYCEGFEGEYAASACDQSETLLTCINQSNMLMPLLRFNNEIEMDMATQMCSMMGGKTCSK